MADVGGDPATLTHVQKFVVSIGLGRADSHGIGVSDLVELLPWAAEHRLVGLLHDAATALGSTVPDEIAAHQRAMLRHAVGVEVDACRAVTALRAVGINPIVFKGVAAAHLDYPDPGLRTFYDVDPLVPRPQLARAAQCLQAAGWSRAPSKLGAAWEARFARAVQFVSPSGIELDLHAALGPGYFGVRLDHHQLLGATEVFELGGIDMCGFDADARLLTSAYALVLTRGGSLRLLRDVAQQILVSEASYQRAALLAGDGDVVVAAALATVDEVIELPLEARRWAASISPRRAQRRAITLARRAQNDGWRSDALGEMLALGWADRWRYTQGIVRSRIGPDPT